MEEKYYTIGEIFRLGLIKSQRTGGAFKHRPNLTVALREISFKEVQTPHGRAKVLSESQIAEFNNRLKKAKKGSE